MSDTFLVGIDLGTSRTAIVTEDGQKKYVETVIGWPKDVIGIKITGKSVVFGEEAYNLRDSLDLCYPLKEGVIQEGDKKNKEGAEELLKHLLSLIKVPSGKKVCGVVGVPARASIQSRNILKSIAGNYLEEVMLISEPFAIAYKTGKLAHSIIVDIGGGTTDLCAMKGRIPDEENQITLTKAGNYVDEILFGALKNKFPDTQLTLKIAKRLKEKFGTVEKPKEKIIVPLRVQGKPKAHDITEEIINSCSILIPDIVEEIEKLIVSFDPDFQDAAMKNIILAGGMSGIKGLGRAIEKSLSDYGEVKVTTAGDTLYSGAQGALSLGKDIPVKYWREIGDFSQKKEVK